MGKKNTKLGKFNLAGSIWAVKKGEGISVWENHLMKPSDIHEDGVLESTPIYMAAWQVWGHKEKERNKMKIYRQAGEEGLSKPGFDVLDFSLEPLGRPGIF